MIKKKKQAGTIYSITDGDSGTISIAATGRGEGNDQEFKVRIVSPVRNVEFGGNEPYIRRLMKLLDSALEGESDL